jgi:hypoxanthine phosphoribosyltransferase
MVGILDSGFVFLADLMRTLNCRVVCHFVKMEWIDSVLGAQPIRNIIYGPLSDFEGKNVLLVDALVDSGITLDHLVQQLLLKKPKSVRTAVLIDRENRRRLSFQVDYAAFTWEGDDLIGYGMERDGLYRNFPYVARFFPNLEPGTAAKGGAVTQ